MAPAQEEEDDDDYMSMTFSEPTPNTAGETSFQRRQRLKREAEIRGRPKSKSELAAEAAAARDEALRTSLLDSSAGKKSKGLSMMKKMGFQAGDKLGSGQNEDTRTEPIKLEIKDDRGGIGLDSEKKRKVNEAAAQQAKKVKVDEVEFRDRVRKEREEARRERQVYAAMKVCEGMDEERLGKGSLARDDFGEEGSDDEADEKDKDLKTKKAMSTRPLKSIPVVWRALVRRREEAERDRRMRFDLEQSSMRRLPTYVDDLEDDDDKKALGKTKMAYTPVEDLEEEDPELDEFIALEVDERLLRIVEYLRKEFRYCFWCKFTYPDEALEGCPGLTEEDHD
jgi:hypothetical protein